MDCEAGWLYRVQWRYIRRGNSYLSLESKRILQEVVICELKTREHSTSIAIIVEPTGDCLDHVPPAQCNSQRLTAIPPYQKNGQTLLTKKERV